MLKFWEESHLPLLVSAGGDTDFGPNAVAQVASLSLGCSRAYDLFFSTFLTFARNFSSSFSTASRSSVSHGCDKARRYGGRGCHRQRSVP